MVCGRRFSGGRDFTKEDIWEMYLHGKQTIAQISETTGLSASTVTRRLASISFSWEQPRIKGSGVIHLDATYFGRNTGVLLALESGSGRLLYMKHIAHEHISDYEDAVKHIVGCGYAIQGIVIDGFQKLFTVLSEYRIQMCQFHMVAIIRRKLTKNPQLEAGKELLDLAYRLKDMNESAFVSAFEKWKRKWHDFLKDGQRDYRTHDIYPSTAQICHGQHIDLPSFFVYIRESQRYAQHKQYDRRHIHRHEESLAESSGND